MSPNDVDCHILWRNIWQANNLVCRSKPICTFFWRDTNSWNPFSFSSRSISVCFGLNDWNEIFLFVRFTNDIWTKQCADNCNVAHKFNFSDICLKHKKIVEVAQTCQDETYVQHDKTFHIINHCRSNNVKMTCPSCRRNTCNVSSCLIKCRMAYTFLCERNCPQTCVSWHVTANGTFLCLCFRVCPCPKNSTNETGPFLRRKNPCFENNVKMTVLFLRHYCEWFARFSTNRQNFWRCTERICFFVFWQFRSIPAKETKKDQVWDVSWHAILSYFVVPFEHGRLFYKIQIVQCPQNLASVSDQMRIRFGHDGFEKVQQVQLRFQIVQDKLKYTCNNHNKQTNAMMQYHKTYREDNWAIQTDLFQNVVGENVFRNYHNRKVENTVSDRFGSNRGYAFRHEFDAFRFLDLLWLYVFGEKNWECFVYEIAITHKLTSMKSLNFFCCSCSCVFIFLSFNEVVSFPCFATSLDGSRRLHVCHTG